MCILSWFFRLVRTAGLRWILDLVAACGWMEAYRALEPPSYYQEVVWTTLHAPLPFGCASNLRRACAAHWHVPASLHMMCTVLGSHVVSIAKYYRKYQTSRASICDVFICGFRVRPQRHDHTEASRAATSMFKLMYSFDDREHYRIPTIGIPITRTTRIGPRQYRYGTQ